MIKKDKEQIGSLYYQMIQEKLTPLAVEPNAKSDGESGGLKPGELPADTKSTGEIQKGTGAENVKNVETPEEADEKINPVKKDKGTNKTATKKTVTEADVPKKSFETLYNSVMLKEDDIESDSYDDETGDFPEPADNIPADGEEGMEGAEMGEGEIYSQLSDLFGQLASLKGAELEPEVDPEMGNEEPDMGMEGETDATANAGGGMGESTEEELNTLIEMRKRLAKKVMKSPDKYDKDQVEKAKKICRETVEEAVSKPEPEELISDISSLQAPRSLAGKGVDKPSNKTAAIKGNDKKRTGELEKGPEGFSHDKSKFAVKGDGPIHKANNASFLEN